MFIARELVHRIFFIYVCACVYVCVCVCVSVVVVGIDDNEMCLNATCS